MEIDNDTVYFTIKDHAMVLLNGKATEWPRPRDSNRYQEDTTEHCYKSEKDRSARHKDASAIWQLTSRMLYKNRRITGHNRHIGTVQCWAQDINLVGNQKRKSNANQ